MPQPLAITICGCVLGVLLTSIPGCGSRGYPGDTWTGTVDTLTSGQVRVHNASGQLWAEGEEWEVLEDIVVGVPDVLGPDLFGQIASFDIDDGGRFWILERQTQELRVFSATGAHVRTIGRTGGGPGEFRQAVHVEFGPDGHVWVMDPENSRLSTFDTAGTYVQGKPVEGGFIMMPWPGRFDRHGSYYIPAVTGDLREPRVAMVRFDSMFTAVDTLEIPTDPIERGFFEMVSATNMARTGIPFQGTMITRLSDRGTIWALITDQYRLFELAPRGDTILSFSRAYTSVPVTEADREQARKDLDWFTQRGGQIDLSRLPSAKPPAVGFFVDDEDHIWVNRVSAPEAAGRIFDVFAPDGRFLGEVTLPFPLSLTPFPIARGGYLYGVTQDDLEVSYVVRARIVKPQ